MSTVLVLGLSPSKTHIEYNKLILFRLISSSKNQVHTTKTDMTHEE